MLQYAPKMLQSEYRLRGQYDPKLIEQQLGLQERYGPRTYADMIAAQKQLDPYGTAVRAQMGQAVSKDLALGTKLDPAFAQQLQTEIRGAQAARGNVAGNAGISGEGLYQGRAAQQMYQQRLSNAGQFLSLRTPEADMAFVPGVQAPDQFRIVNPNAGYLGQQVGQQGYQNQLAAYSMGNQGGGWTGAASGAAGGAAAGGTLGGGNPYAVAGGAVIGGVSGYFSDARIKENVHNTGKTTKDGIPIVTFNYIGQRGRYRGVIAQDVIKVRPEAVRRHGGLLAVDYGAIGATLEAI
jgi:hypothetical protein